MKKHSLLKTSVILAVIGCAMSLSVLAEEVSNDVFTVTVPDEISDICDVETGTDTIAFYESLSHGEYGGFVAEIQLYKSVKDYGYLPNYRRGGQIILTDGTKLDVVLEFPSDVQFDVENQESIDNYHLISDTFTSRIAPSIVPVDGVFTPQDEIDTTAVYAEVLDTLRAEIEQEADFETLEGDGYSGLYAYLYGEEAPLSKIGCLYEDLNADGYCELAIGMVGDNAVYDLFTQQDGEVLHVFSGGERDIFTLSGDDYGNLTIRETASGGAALTHITMYGLDQIEAQLYQYVTFIYDGQENPDAPYRILYFEGDEGESVSEEEWNDRMNDYGTDIQPDYTPLG